MCLSNESNWLLIQIIRNKCCTWADDINRKYYQLVYKDIVMNMEVSTRVIATMTGNRMYLRSGSRGTVTICFPQLIPRNLLTNKEAPQIPKFMEPTWDPPGSCRPRMDPTLAPWTLLSGSNIFARHIACDVWRQVALSETGRYHQITPKNFPIGSIITRGDLPHKRGSKVCWNMPTYPCKTLWMQCHSFNGVGVILSSFVHKYDTLANRVWHP